MILSGCRCAAHNKAVGGAEHSTHLQGKAADIRVEGCSPRALYDEAKKVPHFKGFGVDDERGFIHVDVRDIPARWCYHNGREAIWRER